jgi:hypothetical protein
VRWTIFIVAGLVVIGIAASVDALRGEPAARRPAEPEATTEETTTQRTPTPGEVLSSAGVTGTLYFTLQVEDGCVLQTLSLPRLEGAATTFLINSCEFDVSPEGNIVTGPSCPGDGVRAGPPGAGRTAQRFRGCAPAWRPDGELTFVRDGDVVTAGGEVLVRDLTRAGHPWFSRRRPVTVQALAWLTETRLAAILRGRSRFGGHELLVFAEGRRAFSGEEVAEAASLYVDRVRQEVWIAQPGDDFSPPGVVVYTRSGAFLRTAPFRANVNAFAAASDRWFALGRPDNICIHERRNPPPREEFPLTCLPFDVVDLAWV